MSTLREAAVALLYEIDHAVDGEGHIGFDAAEAALRAALAPPEERGAEWRAGWEAGREAAALRVDGFLGTRADFGACLGDLAFQIRALSPPEEPPREACPGCGLAKRVIEPEKGCWLCGLTYVEDGQGFRLGEAK